MANAPAQTTIRPVASVTEAQQVMSHLADVMDALLDLVEQETALVRAGKLRESAALEPTKANLAGLFMNDSARLKVSKDFIKQTQPEALASLRGRHDRFRALLQINLTVLATAHAVSEGIMRGVAQEVTRKTAPQTYGASGRAAAPGPRQAQPLTVSRIS
jgi:hypothetical protein